MLTAVEADTAVSVNYIQALRIITEELTTLPPKSFQLLLFICARTLRYGKDKERIPLKHFIDGIKDGAGKWVQKPVGVAKNAISDGLIALEDAGLIHVNKAHSNVRVIQINYEIFSDGVDHMESRLRKSKKERLLEKNQDDNMLESDNMVSPNQGNQFPQNRETSFPKLGQPNIRSRSLSNRSSNSAKAQIESVIENAKKRSVGKETKLPKHKMGIKLFHELVKERFPLWKLISTTPAAARNFRLAIDTLTEDEVKEFVTATVENWGNLITNNFSYLAKTNPTLHELPCFNTFGMSSAKFLQHHINSKAVGDSHSRPTLREVRREARPEPQREEPARKYKTATFAERYGTENQPRTLRITQPKEIPQHVLDFNRRAEEIADREGISLIDARTKLALEG